MILPTKLYYVGKIFVGEDSESKLLQSQILEFYRLECEGTGTSIVQVLRDFPIQCIYNIIIIFNYLNLVK